MSLNPILVITYVLENSEVIISLERVMLSLSRDLIPTYNDQKQQQKLFSAYQKQS